MKFEGTEVKEFPEFLSAHDNNVLLEHLLERKPLWETRTDRITPYKNAEWYTLGSALYLDLAKKDDWVLYCEKVKYFNSVLQNEFTQFWRVLTHNLKDATGEEFDFAHKLYDNFGMPGFHIFPPHMAGCEFFGKKHQDLQWMAFTMFPGLEEKAMEYTDHFSGTYTLVLPKQGPHFLFCAQQNMVFDSALNYQERALYLHSGQFEHAIAPLQRPITFLDWRITLQFHGFSHEGKNWLYW